MFILLIWVYKHILRTQPLVGIDIIYLRFARSGVFIFSSGKYLSARFDIFKGEKNQTTKYTT